LWITSFYLVREMCKFPLNLVFLSGSGIHIGGMNEISESCVYINSVMISTEGCVETIAEFLARYLAFNLRHSRLKEATLEGRASARSSPDLRRRIFTSFETFYRLKLTAILTSRSLWMCLLLNDLTSKTTLLFWKFLWSQNYL